jgi:hypothetical protein
VRGKFAVDTFIFFSIHPLIKNEGESLCNQHTLCVCACIHIFKRLNQWIDLHKIWLERYAIGDHPNFLLFKFCACSNNMADV